MLLTAGCSFVWGDELDGFDQNPPTHNNLTMTHLLATSMKMDYINMGICGSCNDRIFRHVTDYLADPKKENPSHMVIIWSAWQRQELVEHMSPYREANVCASRPENATQYSPVRLNVIGDREVRASLQKYYKDLYDCRTDIMHGITMIKTMELLCQSLGIKLIQGVFHYRCWSNIMSVLNEEGAYDDGKQHQDLGSTPDYRKWLKDSLGALSPNSRLGLGRGPSMYEVAKSHHDVKEFGHPGEITQIAYSQMLKKMFDDM